MTTPITKIEVFISSPSDLKDEREIIKEVCEEINLDRGRRDDFVLEAVKWETHSRPSVGKDAQEVITQQIGDDYDIYVGILGSRFGTPTQNAGSGTEDEFETAIARHKAGENIEIMFYFRDPKTAPGELSGEQLLKVEDFKKSIATKGVRYHDYQEVDQFKIEVSRHFSGAVSDVLKNKQASSPSTEGKITEVTEMVEEVDPLANLRAVMNQNDDGIMDLVEQADEELELFNQDAANLTSAITDLGDQTNDSVKVINNMVKMGKTTKRDSKPIMGTISLNMETYTNRVAELLPRLHDHLGNGLDLMGRAINISIEDTTVLNNEKAEIRESLNILQQSILEAMDSMGGFNNTVNELPRMTSHINRAKRRVVAVNDDLLALFRRAIAQLEEMLFVLSED